MKSINTGRDNATRYAANFFEEVPAPTPPADQPVVPAPAAPTEPVAPATPAPASSTEPTTQPAAPVAAADGTPPADPAAPVVPAEPRESAIAKRARELREKAAGQTALADRLERTAATPATPAAPAAPIAAPTTPPQPGDDLEPDYFDPETGDIDPAKHVEFTRRLAAAEAQKIVKAAGAETELVTARSNYVASVSSDAQALAAEYDELNPESDLYDQELDDHLTDAYTRATTNAQGQVTRIDMPLKDFVEREMKVISKYRTKAAAQTPNAEAAAGTDGAIVPGPALPPTDKPFGDLSIPEMEARLGKPARR